MALTPEQVQQYRTQYKLDTPSSKSTLPTATTKADPNQLQARLKAIDDAASGKKLVSANSGGGSAQPQDAGLFHNINAPAYNISNESNPVKAVAKEGANIVKSGAKFGKDVLASLNPINTVKNLAKIPGAVVGLAKDQMSAETSQRLQKSGADKIIQTISDKKAKGEDTSHLENYLLSSGVLDKPEDVTSVKFLLGQMAKGTYESVVPQAAQKAFQGKFTQATESLAEDPFQVAPLLLGTKALLEETPVGQTKVGQVVDNAVSKTANLPKDIVTKTGQVVADTTKAALDKVNYKGTGIKQLIPEQPIEQQLANLDRTIEKGVSKGVKPTVVGKKTLPAQSAFYDSAKNAVKTIADNRNNLTILDENGQPTTHPSTNAQFAQAIDQTKQSVYKQYNDMTKAATGKEAQVSVDSTVAKLEKITGNPSKGVAPDLKYNSDVRAQAARAMKDVKELQNASPEVIEARIADYNQTLSDFYSGKNVSKAKAQVDASIASELRRVLDDKISQTEGEGYSALKKQYGDLKAIEGEVNKRALVEARKNQKGLSDLTDIFTGGEMVSGILTLNPALVAKGVFGKVIQQFYKALNSPDRNVSTMFRKVYDVYDKADAQGVDMKAPKAAPKFLNGVDLKQKQLPAPKAGAPDVQINVPMQMPTKIHPLESGTRNRVEVNPARLLPEKSSTPAYDPSTMRLPSKTQSTLDAEATKNLQRVGGKFSRRYKQK